MNKLLFGLMAGAVLGAVAYKKIEDAKLPEKALETAQEKLKGK